MAKKRKTRQQKISSDLRQQHLSPRVTPSSQISLNDLGNSTTFTPSQTIATSKTIHLDDYAYVRHDLLKTLFITSAIIVAQVVLFFLAGR